MAHSLSHSQPSRAILPEAKSASMTSSVSAPELPTPATTALLRTVERAPLRIEIESTVKDGALAIFADQTVVYTTELRDGHVWPNDKPGFGVDIDEEKAKKYPISIPPIQWTQSRWPDGTLWTP